MGLWERFVVPRLIGACCGLPEVTRRRALVVPRASGRVLELGCGGGLNLALLDPSRVTSLSGVDPSPALLERTRARWRSAPFEVSLVAGVAEALPFEAESFDTVLSTFTLCSVEDPARTLAEALRVLRPGGRLIFLEHGRAPDAGTERWQRRIEPLWSRLAGGCQLTRPVTRAVVEAGFAPRDTGSAYMRGAPRFVGWTEWGEAERLP